MQKRNFPTGRITGQLFVGKSSFLTHHPCNLFVFLPLFFSMTFFVPSPYIFFLQKLPYPTLYFYSLFSWERGGTIGCLINKSPKFYINGFLFVRLTTLGTLIEFLYLCCFIMFSIIVSTIILINRRVNFVYHHWGRTSIYRPLSYPIRIPVNLYIPILFILCFVI